jgi:hypothetical protein
VLTTAFDVLGARRALPGRSLLPVTDVPDSTAITVPGTAPVRCVGFTRAESGVSLEADGPAMALAGLPEAAAGLAAPAASPATVTTMTDAATSFFRRIHAVALINVLPPGTSCQPAIGSGRAFLPAET